MAKPEWGTKRSCLSCGVAFYDMKKSPIVCPKCGEKHDPQPLLKPRRTGPAAKAAPVVNKPAPEKVADSEEEIEDIKTVLPPENDDGDDVVGTDDDETDDALMEDATDLIGEDDDEDMAEVKEHIEPDSATD